MEISPNLTIEPKGTVIIPLAEYNSLRDALNTCICEATEIRRAANNINIAAVFAKSTDACPELLKEIRRMESRANYIALLLYGVMHPETDKEDKHKWQR